MAFDFWDVKPLVIMPKDKSKHSSVVEKKLLLPRIINRSAL